MSRWLGMFAAQGSGVECMMMSKMAAGMQGTLPGGLDSCMLPTALLPTTPPPWRRALCAYCSSPPRRAAPAAICW